MRRNFVMISSWIMLLPFIQPCFQSVENLEEMENYGTGV